MDRGYRRNPATLDPPGGLVGHGTNAPLSLPQSAAQAHPVMAVERSDAPQRTPIPRAGQIRRCSVRHVAIVQVPGGRDVQVSCLLGGPEHPLPLGRFEEARPICNACTAKGIWRADED
jgi:hypothetical protein